MERLTGMSKGIYGIKASKGYMSASEILPGDQTVQMVQQGFDRLAAYELTGMEPGQLKEIDQMYLEKCQEVTYYKKMCSGAFASDWIPVEKQLPDPNTDVLVSVQSVCPGGGAFMSVDCIMDEGDGLIWRTHYKALERVLAWMPLPSVYCMKKA